MHIEWILPGGSVATSLLCGEYNGKADQCPTRQDGHYYKRFRYNCRKVSCRNCYDKQVVRTAHFGLERLNNIRKIYYCFGHRLGFGELILSPPSSMYDSFRTKEGLNRIRARCIRYAVACGVIGGMVVVHPYRGRLPYMERIRQGTITPEPSYHFHVIGLRIDDWVTSSVLYNKTGWVYKWVDEYTRNGKLRNMYDKIEYELNHAGLYTDGTRYGPINSWFGICSRSYVQQHKHITHDPVMCPVCNLQAHRYEIDESVDVGPATHKRVTIEHTIPPSRIECVRAKYELHPDPMRTEILTYDKQPITIYTMHT